MAIMDNELNTSDSLLTKVPFDTDAQAPEAPAPARREMPGGKPWSARHDVNLRLSVPVFGNRYYLTLVAGREKRSQQRLAFERRKHPLKTTGNILFMLAVGTLLGVGAIALILFTALAILQWHGALAAL